MSMLADLTLLIRDDAGAVALIEPTATGHRRWTRGELGALVAAQAGLLRGCGVGPGDCVGVWLPTWADAIAWQYAARAVGAHAVGINTRYNVTEVGHVLELGRPKVVVLAAGFVGLDLVGRLREALTTHPGSTAPLVVPVAPPGTALPDRIETYDAGAGALAAPAPRPDLPLPDGSDPDELAVAFTTSGSTGLPKLAAHRDAAVAEHAREVAAALALRPSDVVVAPLPYSGTFGYSAIMAGIHAGGAVLLHPSFDPEALLDDIAAYGGTHVAFGDDMLGRIHLAWQARHRDLSSLRWIGIADFNGESHALARWAKAEFGTETVGVYGSSEVFALTTFWSVDDPEPQRWSGGGHLVNAGMQVRVTDDGKPVAAGVQGEIELRGPNVVDAYLGQPELLAQNVSADGWFRTGDLGRLTDERSFEYVCRASDALRLKGFLVEPDEIAARLGEHPDVQVAKVVGARRGNETVAVGFVTLRPGARAGDADLFAHCAERLARFKVPAQIHVITEMPVTAGTNGAKIRAATLREWARDGVPPQYLPTTPLPPHHRSPQETP
ncbi:AMP-binding protein [Cumulibacter manganitolerans]|uniref:AMP-binding protein n=1 Tax=Cumulibacter manganitolerans TaxID=1884992 RepID=UPI001296E992|nr:AMP-binding protein [Cumulibacter manganitolerans]